VEQQEELALALQKHVSEVVFHRLASIQGHDSFLVDMDRFRPVMARFLS
jgi:homoserine acetyltransferase